MRWRKLGPIEAAPAVRDAGSTWWREETLPDWLQRWRQETPRATALCSEQGRLGYAELAERVERVAGGLSRLGVGVGDVVAVQLPNGIEFVTTYLAITWCGAVMQTVHMPYRGAELDFLLRHGGARVFVCLGQFKDLSPAAHALAMAAAGPRPEHVVAVGPAPAGAVPFGQLAAGPALAARAAVTSAHPFLLLYTSGTTANPKGVPHAYRNFLCNSRASVPELEITAGDVLLSLAPMSHLYGLFVLHLGLAAGAAQALVPAFAPDAFAQVMQRERATRIFAAPAHLAATMAAGLIDRHDFASVKSVCLSGSAVSPLLAQQVEAALQKQTGTEGGRTIQLWGMTELQAGAYTRPGDAAAVRYGSAGRASPGTELRVVGDDGTALPPGIEGRLQVRGPSLFAGYLDNAQATKVAFSADGWFDTGDTARLSTEGHLTLTGRSTETINRGGVKFNPVDVELVLEQHAAVERCAMVPMADAVLGERACLFVVPRGGQRPTLQELTAWLDAKGIAKFKWPERLELIEAMPLTPTQKIMRGRLLEWLHAAG
jgi:acyl-coenzyme A synthetase/AMP-(fatty) acid ligase